MRFWGFGRESCAYGLGFFSLRVFFFLKLRQWKKLKSQNDVGPYILQGKIKKSIEDFACLCKEGGTTAWQRIKPSLTVCPACAKCYTLALTSSPLRREDLLQDHSYFSRCATGVSDFPACKEEVPVPFSSLSPNKQQLLLEENMSEYRRHSLQHRISPTAFGIQALCSCNLIYTFSSTSTCGNSGPIITQFQIWARSLWRK